MLVDTAARTWTAGSGDEARRTAEYFRACVEPFTAVCAFVAARAYDVRELLGSVRARTLVIQRRDAPSQRLDVAQQDLARGSRYDGLLANEKHRRQRLLEGLDAL